ncbi:MAG: Rhodococcus phage [Actinomycetota bacterium]|jgi:acetoin utilization deacetylase AcuC-like enzyme
MKVYYNDSYVSPTDGFPTVAKAGAVARSLGKNPITGVELADPVEFMEETERLVRRAHGGDYVDAVISGSPADLAGSSGLTWTPGTWGIALAHSAGLVAAVDTALSGGTTAGSFSSGLHHARRNEGMGFCTLNGLAVACLAAIARGCGRVLVWDHDAHCGGGTFSIMEGCPAFTQIDVSTSFTYDRYRAHGDHRRVNARTDRYLEAIEEGLVHAAGLDPFDLIIVNSGMDPVNDGVPARVMQTREKMVRDFVGDTPAVFAFAGGYTWGGHTMDDIVSWHLLTVREWASR